MRIPSPRSTWYSSEVDPEHIWYRGFEVDLAGGALATGDTDVAPFPAIQLVAAWGSAARCVTRESFPFDFEPIALVGSAHCHEGRVPAPAAALSALPFSDSSARGAWIGWEDYRVDDTDVLEVVIGASPDGYLPATFLVAQIVFDLSRPAVDPFVVAATRVLEPLLSELRWALSMLDHDRSEQHVLAAQVDRLEHALRAETASASRLRVVLKASLATIAAVVLNILANRIDAAVPWDVIWTAVQDATLRLGL